MLPLGVMPMHCSANVGDDGDTALFFGLSGTGKTTLSSDPRRRLIGDDEHGWSDTGVFNFEGGCYAKVIKLSAAEPQIYATTKRFGTILENVVIDPDARTLDLDDASLTENTRGSYPINFIDNAELSGRAGHPAVMLTADAYGVLPPIARLTLEERCITSSPATRRAWLAREGCDGAEGGVQHVSARRFCRSIRTYDARREDRQTQVARVAGQHRMDWVVPTGSAAA